MMTKFLKVKCNCGTEMIIFGNATTKIDCNGCKETLAEPTGGKVHVLGKVIEEME
ncbi:30S ribosomal protein S27e [Candidatus Micrarchaeota archaeon]|nr:30S ribosomal protein S27e [Candidatus Micrarchaeota archaeon]